MSEDIHYIVYTSAASKLLNDQNLTEILNSCRRNNQKLNVTGMLLYSEGVFIQVLEGAENTISELYQRILIDPRHHSTLLLTRGISDTRQFPDWRMGFRKLSRKQLAVRSGITDFLSPDFDCRQFLDNPSVPHKLLLSFRKNM
ncbi:MAG: BLUF domain-containing protein [Endozoicomonas sp.]